MQENTFDFTEPFFNWFASKSQTKENENSENEVICIPEMLPNSIYCSTYQNFCRLI